MKLKRGSILTLIWIPARAAGLGPADQIELGQDLARNRGHLSNLRPFDSRHRIEVDAQLVGMGEIGAPHRVRMQLQAAEVGDPQAAQRLVIDNDLVGGAAGRKLERHRVDVGRQVLGCSLLVKGLLADAVDEAAQDERPIVNAS